MNCAPVTAQTVGVLIVMEVERRQLRLDPRNVHEDTRAVKRPARADPGGRMTSSADEDQPLVSMVIPVYNSLTYLSETLDSMLDQGLSENELEVILVNDGSDDGSERVVDEYAARYPNFRVIHQEQSGGPATPCNVGAYAARGRYFFLLGSDDVMTPNALRDLVTVAEREESDVVLGKLGSLGGRGTPKSVYKKTVYDADLLPSLTVR